ncbi:MAG: hypothetical protein QOF49_2328, partial [Chloroflexota bacterium]|nr:hypothetical protein [Chloroflexota bacterium]
QHAAPAAVAANETGRGGVPVAD